MQQARRLFDPAHLVGLHISLPQDWVESAGAGGRQRDEVVKQRPQLLFAEPCRQEYSWSATHVVDDAASLVSKTNAHVAQLTIRM